MSVHSPRSFFLKIFPFFPSTASLLLLDLRIFHVLNMALSGKFYTDCHALWSQDPQPALIYVHGAGAEPGQTHKLLQRCFGHWMSLHYWSSVFPLKLRILKAWLPFPFFFFPKQPCSLPAKLLGPWILQGPPSFSGSRQFPHQSFSLVDGTPVPPD